MDLKYEIRNVTLGLMLPALWAAGIGTAAAAKPRTETSTVTHTGPAGNTTTRQTTATTNGAGGYSATSTITGSAGKTATRQSTGSYNAATKTLTRSGTTTLPDGKTASFSSSTQLTGNGYDRTATHTGPNGNTVTSTGQGTYNPSTGTVNKTRTTTGPNGNSATENRSVTVAPAQPTG